MDDISSSGSPEPVGVRFTGETGEYFRIWIVNIALTVLTLGIYSAWAKVRTLRYFYTHTSIQSGNFDYHADPKAILFGRAIAVAALLIYYLLSQYLPAAGLAVLLVIIALIPVLTVRSRIFQMRNTSFHGLRFDFNRNYKDAFKAIYGGALISVLSLGFATPIAVLWRNRFVADNSAYGQSPFELSTEATPFYMIYVKAFGLLLVGLIAFMLFSIVISPLTGPTDPENISQTDVWLAILPTLPLLLVYGAVGVYVQVRQRNLVWSNTTLDRTSFVSTLSVQDMCVIYLTNILAIAFSLGLATPWAKIRLARYRAQHMEVLLQQDWDQFVSSGRQNQSALGEEIGDAFDVGVDVAF